jgi:hypothetical protein
MAKKSKGMVLYEVIRQNQARLKNDGKPEAVGQKKRKKKPDTPKNCGIAFGNPRQKPANNWPPRAPGLENALLRNKLARRVRFMIGPAKMKALLLVILLVFIVVKSIQFFSGTTGAVDTTVTEVVDQPVEAENGEMGPEDAGKTKELVDQAQVLAPVGDHTIVIMTYSRKKDLVPAKDFFAERGLETRIEKRGDYFFLLTANRFMSPKRTGTDGYDALRKIKQIGAEYKAPPDFETFGEKPFQDAYGMKIR